MTAFTVRWDYVVVLRPALKHNHTHTRPLYHDITEKHTFHSLSPSSYT